MRAEDRRPEVFVAWEGAATDSEVSAQKGANVTGRPVRVHYHSHSAWAGGCNARCHDVEPDPNWGGRG